MGVVLLDDVSRFLLAIYFFAYIMTTMSDATDTSQPDLKLVEQESEEEMSDEESGQQDAAAEPKPGIALSPESIVEAVLFAADSPLPPAKMVDVVGQGTAKEVKKWIAALNQKYDAQDAAFRIEEIAGGYQFLTLPQYNEYLAKLLRVRQETKLSQAALETLAIVAYKQPALRADVEAIRGVACGEILNRLREINLIKIVGRAEDVGRPMLYGTTKKFLEVFGLGSLEDLPNAEELTPP